MHALETGLQAPASFSASRPMRFVSTLVAFVRALRVRSDLSELDDRMLADIGLTRSQINEIAFMELRRSRRMIV